MKHMTRRQAEYWLGQPIKHLHQMKVGVVDTVDGFLVEMEDNGRDYARLDGLITGFGNCLKRLFPSFDFVPMDAVVERLGQRDPVFLVHEIDDCIRMFRSLAKPLMLTPFERVQEASRQEVILNHLEGQICA